MSEPHVSFAALTGRMATAGVGESIALGAGTLLCDTLVEAAPDLVSTGVAVVAHHGHASPGTRLVVLGERSMAHHLASAADVEIPVRLLATEEVTREEGEAVLSRVMLQVLVAVS